MQRVQQLEQQLEQYRAEQASLIAHIGAAVQQVVQASCWGVPWGQVPLGQPPCPPLPTHSRTHLQGSHVPGHQTGDLAPPDAQIAALSTLAEARSYGALLVCPLLLLIATTSGRRYCMAPCSGMRTVHAAGWTVLGCPSTAKVAQPSDSSHAPSLPPASFSPPPQASLMSPTRPDPHPSPCHGCPLPQWRC